MFFMANPFQQPIAILAQAATMEAEGHTRTASLPSLSRQTSEEGGGGGDGGGGGGSSSKLGTEDAEDIRETEIELRFQQRVAQQIARMEVTSSEVVRVTPAFRTFEKGAVAFRKECTGDFYFKSERSEKISTFWSHSWHGGHWKLSWDSDECNPFVLCDETILIIFGSQNSLAILIGNIRIIPLELLHNLRTILNHDVGTFIHDLRNWSE